MWIPAAGSGEGPGKGKFPLPHRSRDEVYSSAVKYRLEKDLEDHLYPSKYGLQQKQMGSSSKPTMIPNMRFPTGHNRFALMY